MCTGYKHNTCAACQKLKALDEKIRVVRATLDLLLDEREAMAGVLNESHDPLAKNLPVEVISRIFGCITTSDFYNPRASLRLTHVCRRWRDVAHATPQLWTYIPVKVRRRALGMDAILKAYLDRSGDLPLYVDISMPETYPNRSITFESFLTSVAAVGRHAGRWKSFFYGGTFSVLSSIATSTPSFAILEVVDIDIIGDEAQDAITLNAAPSVLSMNVSPSELRINVGYRKLKKAEFSDTFSLPDCIRLFQEANQLEDCHLASIGWEHTVQSPVVASSLRQLSISDFPSVFWDQFELPSLTKLEIGPCQTEEGWDALIQCLQRSRCRIEDLTTSTRLPSGLEVVQLLSAMPYLRKLHFEAVTTDELFSTLYKSATLSEQFLAHLVVLSCTPEFNIPLSWPVMFVDAMTARRERTLQSFSYRWSTTIDIAQDMIDKLTLGHILTLAGRIKLTMRTINGVDMLAELCKRYAIDAPGSRVL